MNFIVNALGQELNLDTPDPEHINLPDIAWSLSQLNRFTGRCMRPYSVAEHSMLVVDILQRIAPAHAVGALAAERHDIYRAGLMHDAHEAYTNDMSTPTKTKVWGWRSWETLWEHRVRARFELLDTWSLMTTRTAVKQADLIALATERAQLMPATPTPWSVLEGVEPAAWVDLMSPERQSMTWADWRDRFCDVYDELEFKAFEHTQIDPPTTAAHKHVTAYDDQLFAGNWTLPAANAAQGGGEAAPITTTKENP